MTCISSLVGPPAYVSPKYSFKFASIYRKGDGDVTAHVSPTEALTGLQLRQVGRQLASKPSSPEKYPNIFLQFLTQRQATSKPLTSDAGRRGCQRANLQAWAPWGS